MAQDAQSKHVPRRKNNVFRTSCESRLAGEENKWGSSAICGLHPPQQGCYHGPLLQALTWINEAGSLKNLPYVFDYLLGMQRTNFVLHYFLCLWSLSSMPKNLAAFLKKGEYFILELKSAGLQCALSIRGFNVKRKNTSLHSTDLNKKSSGLWRLQMSNVYPWCPTRRLNVTGRYQSNSYEEY